MERRKPRSPSSVIVIGSGFAGLAAARALKNASFEVPGFGSMLKVFTLILVTYLVYLLLRLLFWNHATGSVAGFIPTTLLVSLLMLELLGMLILLLFLVHST